MTQTKEPIEVYKILDNALADYQELLKDINSYIKKLKTYNNKGDKK